MPVRVDALQVPEGLQWKPVPYQPTVEIATLGRRHYVRLQANRDRVWVFGPDEEGVVIRNIAQGSFRLS